CRKRVRLLAPLFAIGMWLITGGMCVGQDAGFPGEDSIRHLIAVGDTAGWLSGLESAARWAANANGMAALEAVARLMPDDLTHSDPALKAAYRYTATRIAKGFYNQGFYNQALPYYLKAHAHTADRSVPDKLAWYVEMDIASIYNRQGDQERTVYFQGLVEKSLLQSVRTEANPDLYRGFLSRLYTNVSRERLSRGRSDEASTYARLGLQLSDSLHYADGRIANLLILAEIALDSAHTSEAAGWLDRLGAVLPSTDTIHSPHLSPPLLEKMAAYLHLRARAAQFAGHPIDGLAFRQQQLLVLKTAYGNTPRRELAKAYRALAESYLDLD